MSRHLVNHEHTCGCGELHLVVIDLQPFERVLAGIRTELRKLGHHMATEAEALAALSAKLDTFMADVRAALAVIAGPDNTLGPDGQAALDALNAKVDAFEAEVGDADGSDTAPV